MSIMGRINGRRRASVMRGELRRKLTLVNHSRASLIAGMDVRIHRLSATGMLMETDAPLSVGEPIELILPEDVRCLGMVVWASGKIYACQFDKSLPNDAINAVDPEVPDSKRTGEAQLAVSLAENDGEETLGARIKRLRRAGGHSMVRLAAAVGVSKPTLWKWETDAVRPRQDTLRRLANVLGVTELQLLYGSSNQVSQRDERKDVGLEVAEEAIAASKAGIAGLFGIDPSRVRIMIEA